MELGGIKSSRPRVFLLSGTHSAENHAIAAARATLDIFKTKPVTETMWSIGGALVEGFNKVAAELQIPAERFKAAGVACSPWYAFYEADGSPSFALRTLFLQEMIKHGVIIPYIAPSWSHTPADVEKTVAAARESLRVVRQALDAGVEGLLVGPAAKPVFRKFN
jgi:glutamate-1-semialdehyde 2,1-aminomutase